MILYIYIHSIATVLETRVVLLGKQGCSSHTSSATYCAVLCDVSVFTSVVCDIFNDDGVCAGRCVVLGVRCLPVVVCGIFSDVGRVQCCFTSTETVRTIRVCAGRWILRMTMTGSDLRVQ